MSLAAHESRFTCLVIEDCDFDYITFERLLGAINVPMNLRRCAVGEEVMTMLAELEGPSVGVHELPAVIILDLNLPGAFGGREILQAVRKHPRIKRTPVVVFSGSTNPMDIDWCHREGASAYHVKGFDLASFKCVAESVAKFWSVKDAMVLMDSVCQESSDSMSSARARAASTHQRHFSGHPAHVGDLVRDA